MRCQAQEQVLQLLAAQILLEGRFRINRRLQPGALLLIAPADLRTCNLQRMRDARLVLHLDENRNRTTRLQNCFGGAARGLDPAFWIDRHADQAPRIEQLLHLLGRSLRIFAVLFEQRR